MKNSLLSHLLWKSKFVFDQNDHLYRHLKTSLNGFTLTNVLQNMTGTITYIKLEIDLIE